MLDRELLAVLACPCCKGSLESAGPYNSPDGLPNASPGDTPDGPPEASPCDSTEGLVCAACALFFPMRDGIQILLKEEAVPLAEWRAGKRRA